MGIQVVLWHHLAYRNSLATNSSAWEHIVGDLSKGGLKIVEISELDVVLKFSFLQHMEGKTKRMVWGPTNKALERESQREGDHSKWGHLNTILQERLLRDKEKKNPIFF